MLAHGGSPAASAQVRDLAPGLDVDPAVCEYSTNNWQSSTEVTCTCSGVNSTTLTQTITATAVPFNQDSSTQNWVRFSISDTSGYRGDSDAYPVYIDTTGPEAQIGAPRRLKTPNIPITWTASDGVGSGVANYDVQVRVDGGGWSGWLTNTTQTQAGYAGQPGHAYTFRARGRDAVGNAGGWVEAEVSVAGVTKYYVFGGAGWPCARPTGCFTSTPTTGVRQRANSLAVWLCQTALGQHQPGDDGCWRGALAAGLLSLWRDALRGRRFAHRLSLYRPAQ
jgi:hypothetical protein